MKTEENQSKEQGKTSNKYQTMGMSIGMCFGLSIGMMSSAKGFFGPIGVKPDRRGENIGQALLVRTLSAMREYGYAYGIIGWVNEAENFYRKTVGAEYIKGGNPENSVYSNLIMM